MRLLYVTPRPLWPGRRGDQVRTAGLITGLSERHEIRLISQRWQGEAAASAPRLALPMETVDISRGRVLARGAAGTVSSLLGATQPIQAALYDHKSFTTSVERAVEDFVPDAVILTLSRLGALAPRLSGVPIVVDLIDALGANMRRRAARQRSLGWLWRREARRLETWEAALVTGSKLATVVAERDRASLAKQVGEAASTLEVVPFGLDVPSELPKDATSDRGQGGVVALTGNLGYFPTVDAAQWFASQVWPRVHRRQTGCRWLIAGARPSSRLQQLARSAGANLIANPPSLEEVLRGATVSIAPLFAGSGTPIKILEAMALGIPVVTTACGAAGLDGIPPEALEVADHPEQFAEAIDRLLSDRDRRQHQAVTAWEWLRARHHLPRVVEGFEALLKQRLQ